MKRPTQAQVEAAVRTLILWAGDDPDREGVVDTPARVARAYKELFSGYRVRNPGTLLKTTFGDTGYSGMVVLRRAPVQSTCEHHMVPFRGVCTVAYIPRDRRVVGLSKLARVVEARSRRLQIQERLTEEIANDLQLALSPVGVGVVIEAEHQCMTSRGVRTHGTTMVTSSLLGVIDTVPHVRAEFLALAHGRST